jgi:hypothetical protein
MLTSLKILSSKLVQYDLKDIAEMEKSPTNVYEFIALKGETETVRMLQEKLKASEDLTYFEHRSLNTDEPESLRISQGLIHILESGDEIRMILDRWLKSETSTIEDDLAEIQMQIRHINWHIQNITFFGQDEFGNLEKEKNP